MPRVFGVLSIVFASLMLVVVLLGALSTAVHKRRETAAPAPAAPVEAEARPASDVLTGVVGLSFMLLTPALLVIGIGQVRYRRWAARATVVWAMLALVTVGALVLAGALAGAGGASMLAMLPSVGLLAPYPTLLLVFFCRRQTVAAMYHTRAGARQRVGGSAATSSS